MVDVEKVAAKPCWHPMEACDPWCIPCFARAVLPQIKALREIGCYADHNSDCPQFPGDRQLECTCGLSEAITAYAEACR